LSLRININIFSCQNQLPVFIERKRHQPYGKISRLKSLSDLSHTGIDVYETAVRQYMISEQG